MKQLMNHTILFLAALTFAGATAFGQVAENRYLVFFADKAGTPYSIDAPDEFLTERSLERRATQGIPIDERDLPVNPEYIDMITALGEVRAIVPIKWFNALLIETEDEDALDAIADLTSVSSLRGSSFLKIDDTDEREVFQAEAPKSDADYGAALNQISMINGLGLHADGFRGDNLLIGVFDGGFSNLENSFVMNSLLFSGRITATRNFPDENESVFERSTHGTRVLSVMAADEPGLMIGTAPDASYILCITEDVTFERRIEEAHWIAAAEYADSLGVDVINTSLGYTDFDVLEENYTYEDMDGNTTLITRGSDIAASRGILIVTSAGNQGAQAWQYISAPADGDSVLAIGAVDPESSVAAFSSRGPSSDGRVKPNIVAQGQQTAFTDMDLGTATGNGTSFSAPVISGMAASLWQAFPEATAWQVHQAIEASAHLFQMPNDSMGYGIPDFELARTLLETVGTSASAKAEGQNLRLYPNPYADGPLYIIWPEHFAGSVALRIFDMSGRMVVQRQLHLAGENLTSDIARGMSDLKPGLYIAVAENDNGRAAAKFTVR
ncbi:MAG: S8 family serine peptidase [Cryomorphaceae bacterium]